MSVASCLCAIVYALFWRKVTNIGYSPIIVWENQICSADFGYAASPYISKMGCFSNTALIWTKPTDGICTNPANSALHDICTKANFPTWEVCGRGRFWSVEMYTSMGWDPNVSPPPKFPIREQKGNLINPPAAHTITQPSAPKPSANPSSLPDGVMPCIFPPMVPPFSWEGNSHMGWVSSGTHSNHCHHGWCTGTTQNCPEPATERSPTMVHCI